MKASATFPAQNNKTADQKQGGCNGKLVQPMRRLSMEGTFMKLVMQTDSFLLF